MKKGDLQSLILTLWKDEKLPIINGLLLNNGDYFRNIKNTLAHSREIFNPNEKDFNDWFSYINIIQSKQYENYKVYAGDGSHGSDGYILVLTSDDKFLWLLFDEINPIECIEIEDNIIYATNNCGETFILPISEPENYQAILGNSVTEKNSFTVEQIVTKIDKPFLYVDYNELLDNGTIMLSQTDIKNNYYGVPVTLCEGMQIVGYQEDADISGSRDDIVTEGICILNTTGHSSHVKWLLKANVKGIRYMSDILKKGW